MDFKQQLADYQQLINEELTKYLRHEPCYEQRWNEAMEYSLMAGERNLTASLVLNYFSDRIHTIGTRQYNDIIEKGIVTLDVVASFALNSHITLKLKAANLLNPAHRLVREIDDGAETVVLNEYRNGMDASFGVVFDM